MEGENKEVYKECLRNHAASLGSYATDGCGEFTPHSAATSSASSLQCAACGCHRNFHRKLTAAAASYMVEEYGDHHHRIRQQQIMASAVVPDHQGDRTSGGGGGRKRHRTKFTVEQKEKMMGFAEKIGWRLHRNINGSNDDVERFCKGVGITRHVFKVWMHNHKNSSSSSSIHNNNNISSSASPEPYNTSSTSINATTTANASSLTTR